MKRYTKYSKKPLFVITTSRPVAKIFDKIKDRELIWDKYLRRGTEEERTIKSGIWKKVNYWRQ